MGEYHPYTVVTRSRKGLPSHGGCGRLDCKGSLSLGSLKDGEDKRDRLTLTAGVGAIFRVDEDRVNVKQRRKASVASEPGISIASKQ